MITRASVLAVLTMTSQLALAETPADTRVKADESAVVTSSDAGEAPAPAEATESQIKSLARDLRPSLQSKLDAQMDIEMQLHSREAIASVD